jgi:hypothetical protein
VVFKDQLLLLVDCHKQVLLSLNLLNFELSDPFIDLGIVGEFYLLSQSLQFKNETLVVVGVLIDDNRPCPCCCLNNWRLRPLLLVLDFVFALLNVVHSGGSLLVDRSVADVSDSSREELVVNLPHIVHVSEAVPCVRVEVAAYFCVAALVPWRLNDHWRLSQSYFGHISFDLLVKCFFSLLLSLLYTFTVPLFLLNNIDTSPRHSAVLDFSHLQVQIAFD